MKRIACQLLLLLLLPLIPAAVSALWHPQGPPLNPMTLAEGEVSVAMVQQWDEPVIWVDARSPEVFAEAHIPSAVNLYAGSFDEQILAFLDVWEPGKKVVVYCDSRECGASGDIARRLREEMQLDNIFVLKGGWQSWQSEK